MVVDAAYSIGEETQVYWDRSTEYVFIDGSRVVREAEIDDLIEALQRIKADLARAKGGAS
jgi:hypothetical protein